MPKNYRAGITLLISILALSATLAIALGIFSIFYGQLRLGQGARESYVALYGANVGVECAKYYDIYNPYDPPTFLEKFFNPTDPFPKIMECAGLDIPVNYNGVNADGFHEFQFSIEDPVRNICAYNVRVIKEPIRTVIEAVARNKCPASGITVERGINYHFAGS